MQLAVLGALALQEPVERAVPLVPRQAGKDPAGLRIGGEGRHGTLIGGRGTVHLDHLAVRIDDRHGIGDRLERLRPFLLAAAQVVFRQGPVGDFLLQGAVELGHGLQVAQHPSREGAQQEKNPDSPAQGEHQGHQAYRPALPVHRGEELLLVHVHQQPP